MAKAELGTKRIDPDTGKKFYDLGRDPIVSPYTGKSYNLSFFESVTDTVSAVNETEVDEDLDEVLVQPEYLSLEEADEEASGTADIPDLEDEESIDSDDDSFIPESDDEENDKVTDLIGDVFIEEEDN